MPISSSNNRSDIPHSATNRVAIVGTGFVGSTSAYALLVSGTVAEIVLIDRDRKRAEGHANDLRDAALFSHNAKVLVVDFSDCHDADVTIIAAGVSPSLTATSRLRLWFEPMPWTDAQQQQQQRRAVDDDSECSRRFHNSGPNKPAQIGLRTDRRIHGFSVCKHSYREKE